MNDDKGNLPIKAIKWSKSYSNYIYI
jgi:hypothetical protein